MTTSTTTTDFYKTLNLDRSVTADEIRKTYRRLALKYHPDKSTDKDAKEVFSKVTEAFDVLSDAKKRAVYDQYGLEGLKNGVPARDGYEGFPGQYKYHGDSDAVFQQFFGGNNPFSDFFNGLTESPVALFGKKFGGMHGMNNTSPAAEGPQQDPPVNHELHVTLEELYLGAVKKMKITRKILEENGMTTQDKEVVLTVNISKGWKDGTQLVFPKEGDQGPNKIPADIVFVVREKSHPVFKRQGNDLVYAIDIPLVKALTNSIAVVKTLDERVLRIPINDVVSPEYTKTIANEGMPLSKNPSQRGNLILKFNVQFPQFLTEEQKTLLKSAFPQK